MRIVRQAKVSDIEGIKALLRKYHRDTISEEDRPDGFVTTAISDEKLEKLIAEESGVTIIADGDDVLGFCFAAPWEFWEEWPLFRHMMDIIPNYSFEGKPLVLEETYQYGPMCIDSSIRGTGAFEELFFASLAIFKDRFPIMLTFVNKINGRSERAHTQKAHMKTISKFDFGDNHYYLMGIKTDDIVISVEEMRAADKYTIEKGTSSKELMRRAAQGIFDAVDQGWSEKKTLVVCGSGNNGGDGYALAEILKSHGHDVTLMRTSEKFSEDGEYYYNRCKLLGVGEVEFVDCNFTDYDIIVDCILGTGFSGVPRDNIAAVIEKTNEAGEKGAFVVSADINSGMNGDTGEAEIAVKSDLTVSIGYYKYGLFRGRSKELIGKLVNVDIGIELCREK